VKNLTNGLQNATEKGPWAPNDCGTEKVRGNYAPHAREASKTYTESNLNTPNLNDHEAPRTTDLVKLAAGEGGGDQSTTLCETDDLILNSAPT
jgi:hypothetical protein